MTMSGVTQILVVVKTQVIMKGNRDIATSQNTSDYELGDTDMASNQTQVTKSGKVGVTQIWLVVKHK